MTELSRCLHETERLLERARLDEADGGLGECSGDRPVVIESGVLEGGGDCPSPLAPDDHRQLADAHSNNAVRLRAPKGRVVGPLEAELPAHPNVFAKSWSSSASPISISWSEIYSDGAIVSTFFE